MNNESFKTVESYTALLENLYKKNKILKNQEHVLNSDYKIFFLARRLQIMRERPRKF